MTPAEKDAYITKLILDIQRGIQDIVASLEEAVAEKIAMDGTVIDRLGLQNLFSQYQSLAAREAGNVASVVTEQPLTDPAFSSLKTVAVETVTKNFAVTAAEVITLLTVGTVAGSTIPELVKQSRGRISGPFMKTRDPVVTRNQRLVGKLFDGTNGTDEQIATAMAVIKDRLAGVNITASLRDLTSRATEEAVMEFDGGWTFHKAKTAGINKFQYEGGLIDSSREWCREHQGKTYTEAQIREIWANSSWSGKKPGNPFIVRGGYKCRHFWMPVNEE